MSVCVGDCVCVFVFVCDDEERRVRDFEDVHFSTRNSLIQFVIVPSKLTAELDSTEV